MAMCCPFSLNERLDGESLTIFGDGTQTRDFIDVRDVVAANVLAYETGANGVFNIGTGIATSVNDLVRHFLDAAGRELPLVFAPPRAGEVLHSVADISKARGGTEILSRRVY